MKAELTFKRFFHPVPPRAGDRCEAQARTELAGRECTVIRTALGRGGQGLRLVRQTPTL